MVASTPTTSLASFKAGDCVSTGFIINQVLGHPREGIVFELYSNYYENPKLYWLHIVMEDGVYECSCHYFQNEWCDLCTRDTAPQCASYSTMILAGQVVGSSNNKHGRRWAPAELWTPLHNTKEKSIVTFSQSASPNFCYLQDSRMQKITISCTIVTLFICSPL